MEFRRIVITITKTAHLFVIFNIVVLFIFIFVIGEINYSIYYFIIVVVVAAAVGLIQDVVQVK